MAALVLAVIGLCCGGEKPPTDAALWTELGTTDSLKAERAIAGLAASPERTIPFLQKRVHPVPIAEPRRLARWLADLDSDEFQTREQATRELEKLGDAAEAALRAALEKHPPPESRRRMRWLLQRLKAERLWPPAGRLRILRAVEILERIGTPKARQFLELLARGAPEAALTIDARSALDRLASQRVSSR